MKKNISNRVLAILLAVCLSLVYVPPKVREVEAAGTGSDVVRVALGEVGYSCANLNSKYGNEVGRGAYNWCMYFVCWCMKQAGVSTSVWNWNYKYGFADYEPLRSGKFHNRGDGYVPKPGDTIHFLWDSDRGTYNWSHIAIVQKVANGVVYTIEGNMGGYSNSYVGQDSYSLNDHRIVGYCEIYYPGIGPSPDPATVPVSCNISQTMQYLTQNIGQTNIIGGRVYATGSAISSVTAGVYRNSSGTDVVDGIQVTRNVGAYSYNLSNMDSDLYFNRISQGGSYYFVVKAKLANGTTKTNFMSFYVKGSTCGVPSISFENIEGGKQVKITSGGSDTIHYSITKNGVNYRSGTAVGSYSEEIKSIGNYSVSAYASRSGYSNSGTKKQDIQIDKVSLPVVRKSVTDSNVVLDIQSATSGANIYYTTSGNTPTLSSNRFSGALSIDTQKTIKAIAVKNGFVNSDIITYEVKLEEPAAPIGFSLNENDSIKDGKIAVGKQISVKWNKTEMASGYNVSLYRDNIKIKNVETTGTTTSFSLDESGKYEIRLYAKNFVGNSEESYPPIKIEAMAPLHVKFVDYNGDIIKEQEVSYGDDATLPDDPARRGYTFVSWDKSDKIVGVTENLTISAQYKINTYSIKFYDASGKQVGSTQKVNFEESAESPEDELLDIPVGYVFAGWKVLESASDSQNDYKKVDSDMKLQAVYYWENDDIPVVTEITSATKNSETGNYNVGVKITNFPNDSTTAVLRVCLRTKEGKLVKTGKREVEVEADGTIEENITLKYNGTATVASAVLLGLNGNDLTGSAYSKEVTKEIIEQSDTVWSEWSEWGEEVLEPSEDTEVEKVTEYRFRDKENTTSTASSLDGWTKYDSKTTYGNWGAWSGYSPTVQTTNDKNVKEVRTETYYRYYWYYCPSCGAYEPLPGWSDCGRYNLTSANFNTMWIAWQYAPTDSHSFSYAPNIKYTDILVPSHRVCFAAGNIYDMAPGTKDANGSGATVIATWYSYRTRTKTTTNYFYRWSDWSDWSTAETVSNDNREIETRTVYRSRKKVPVYSPLAGNEEKGTCYLFNGDLSAVDADLNGKLATVLVYKGKNTDPNEDQIQYVGQTTIGDNNAYSFTVIPKTEPTDLTGDFTVCLGLEGSTGLVMVGLIKAPKSSYIVKYIDKDGSIISEQSIREGENAIVPESPTKEGYIFLGWNANAMNVQSNMIISAVYEPCTYIVAFVDGANGVISFDNYKYGDILNPPDDPSAIGKAFKGWDIIMDGINTVNGNMVINAVYDTEKFIVDFIDENGNFVNKQIVEYGKSANPPSLLDISGKEFKGWSLSEEWWNVTKNMVVEPIFAYADTVDTPSYEIIEYEDSIAVYLSSDTEDADIYYNIGKYPVEYSDEENSAAIKTDDAEETNGFTENGYVYEETQKYDGSPIIIDSFDSDVTENGENLLINLKTKLRTFATHSNMNDSELYTIDYEGKRIVPNLKDEIFKVVFDSNGGKELDNPELCIASGNTVGELPVTTRDGYTFTGWFTDSSEGDEINSDYVVDSDLLLYAHWQKNKVQEYIVTFDVNDGNDIEENSRKIEANKVIGSLPTAEREGYEFLGWFTDKQSGELINETYEVCSDITLFAHWKELEKQNFIVLFDVNGGSEITEKSREVLEGEGIGNLPVVERDNFTFIGWYSDSESGEQIFDSTVVTGNITVYAHWVEAGHIHKEVIDKAVDPTCTTTGLTEGKHCSSCGEIMIKQQVVPVKEHNWDDGRISKESTCNEEGIKTFICKDCGEIRKEPVNKSGHEWETEYSIDKEPTCIEAGSKSIHCKNCDATTDVQIIDALGHKYERIVTPATPDIDGNIIEKCSVCGDSRDIAVISRMKTILVSDVTYTGKKLKPTVVIKDANGQIVSLEYYDLQYSNNVDVGIGIVTITGKIKYSGSVKSAFNILAPKKPPVKEETVDGVGSISADGTTLTDEDGIKYYVSVKLKTNQIKKNICVADKKSGGKYKITKVIKKKGKVVGGNVTYMAPYSMNCTKATAGATVKFGGVKFKITAVNANAFKNCKKLNSFKAGGNVTTIGKNAFNGCTKLKSVTITSTKLKSIGTGAFKGTTAKTKYKVPKSQLSKYSKMIYNAGANKNAKITK